MARENLLSDTASWLALVTFGAVGLGSCDSINYVEAFETGGSIERVEIRGDIGDLEVSGAAREDVWVERAVDGWKGGIALSSEVVDGTLILDARCAGWLGCRVDTRLEIPAGAELLVSVWEGDVALSGLSGPLDLEVDSGELTGEGLTSADVLLSVAAGGAALQFVEPPLEVEVALGGGDLELSLPAGEVRCALELAGGEVVMEGLSEVEGAPTRIQVASASGDVHLSGR